MGCAHSPELELGDGVAIEACGGEAEPVLRDLVVPPHTPTVAARIEANTRKNVGQDKERQLGAGRGKSAPLYRRRKEGSTALIKGNKALCLTCNTAPTVLRPSGEAEAQPRH